MSEWKEQEVIDAYIQNQTSTIAELHNTIGMLQTKVTLLEQQLKKERQEREELPVPKTFINRVRKLQEENEKMARDLEYFEKYLPEEVIINKESKKEISIPVRKGSGLR
jgi:hypothetical protein